MPCAQMHQTSDISVEHSITASTVSDISSLQHRTRAIRCVSSAVWFVQFVAFHESFGEQVRTAQRTSLKFISSLKFSGGNLYNESKFT